MNVRRWRLLLRAVGFGLLTAAVGVAAWAAREPRVAVTEPALAPRAASRIEAAPAVPRLEELAAVWSRPLRRSLVELPARQAADTAGAKPPRGRKGGGTAQGEPLRVVGTVLEAGRSVAILMDASGAIHVRQTGETLGEPLAGAVVEKVERQRVVLMHEGRSIVLEMQPGETP